jgi:hypothetical protein
MAQTEIKEYHKIDRHQSSHYQSTFFVHERTKIKAETKYAPLNFELILGDSRVVIFVDMTELNRFIKTVGDALPATTFDSGRAEDLIINLWGLAERISDTPYEYIVELLDHHREYVETEPKTGHSPDF